MLTASSRASARVPAIASTSPSERAAAREHDAFGQHLRDEPPPAGAERGADRDLLLPRRRPREQQVRQVRAHDQHHHADGAGEHPQRQADPAADLFGAAASRSPRKLLRLRDARAVSCAASVLISACAPAARDAGLQAADHRHRVAPAVGFRRQREREVQIEVAAGREDRARSRTTPAARRRRCAARR